MPMISAKIRAASAPSSPGAMRPMYRRLIQRGCWKKGSGSQDEADPDLLGRRRTTSRPCSRSATHPLQLRAGRLPGLWGLYRLSTRIS